MAARTAHLGAHHPVRAVLDELDGIRRDRLGEARPAGTRVVLRAALEEHVAAGGTVVESLVVSVHVLPGERELGGHLAQDRKSTRLNSSHANISYAVFCLKKNKQSTTPHASYCTPT